MSADGDRAAVPLAYPSWAYIGAGGAVGLPFYARGACSSAGRAIRAPYHAWRAWNGPDPDG